MPFSRSELFVGVAVSLWSLPANALDTYETNCTLPPPNATEDFFYVSSPNVRGSLQIVWTCLLTLTICVYQVLHLNIPEQRNGQDPGMWGDIKWLGIWTDLRWALVAAFAPEWLLITSINELAQARGSLKELHKAIPGTKSTWTLTHMFYVTMGGLIAIRADEPWILGPDHVHTAIANGILSEIAPMTAKEIMDKSKTDMFAKALSVMQIVYFYIDFFARIAQGLPVSQLELGVAALAFFSLIVYACMWHKPKSVQTPTAVLITSSGSEDLVKVFGTVTKSPNVDEWSSYHSKKVDMLEDMSIVVGGVALGAIHLAAWNFDFPSVADLWIWRVASLLVTSCGPLLVAVKYMKDLLSDWTKFDASYPRNLVILVTTILYTIARLVLIVEMIRCLFFLPTAAFKTTNWTSSIPHLG